MNKSFVYMNSVIKACDLGFLPGHWPDTMIYKDHLFNKSYLELMPNNDLVCVEYQCDMPNKSWTLKIYND
jgi:hypothetical protein